MKSKTPSFPFYPGDWRRNPNLSRCSLTAKGLWIELIALMHDLEPRGVLETNGKPWSLDDIARRVGERKSVVKRAVNELESKQVLSRSVTGSITCRRMIREQEISEGRSENAHKRWNRAETCDATDHANHDTKGDAKPMQKSPSSSSPSSSFSDKSTSNKNYSPDDPAMPEPSTVIQTPTKVEPNPEPIAKAKKPPKPKPPPKPKRDPLADPIADRPDLAELWDTAWGWIKTRHPGARSRQPDAGTPHWTSDRIALMHIVDIDNLSANDVRVALNWAFNVEAPQGTWPGWADQVRSIAGLRKLNSQGISKIHSIIEKAERHRSPPAASNGSTHAGAGLNGFGGRGGAYVPFNGSAGIPPGSIKRKYTDEDYRIANERGGFDSDRSTYDAPRFMADRTPEEVAADEAALAKLDIELAAIRGGKGPEINFDDLPF